MQALQRMPMHCRVRNRQPLENRGGRSSRRLRSWVTIKYPCAQASSAQALSDGLETLEQCSGAQLFDQISAA